MVDPAVAAGDPLTRQDVEGARRAAAHQVLQLRRLAVRRGQERLLEPEQQAAPQQAEDQQRQRRPIEADAAGAHDDQLARLGEEPDGDEGADQGRQRQHVVDELRRRVPHVQRQLGRRRLALEEIVGPVDERPDVEDSEQAGEGEQEHPQIGLADVGVEQGRTGEPHQFGDARGGREGPGPLSPAGCPLPAAPSPRSALGPGVSLGLAGGRRRRRDGRAGAAPPRQPPLDRFPYRRHRRQADLDAGVGVAVPVDQQRDARPGRGRCWAASGPGSPGTRGPWSSTSRSSSARRRRTRPPARPRSWRACCPCCSRRPGSAPAGRRPGRPPGRRTSGAGTSPRCAATALSASFLAISACSSEMVISGAPCMIVGLREDVVGVELDRLGREPLDLGTWPGPSGRPGVSCRPRASGRRSAPSRR